MANLIDFRLHFLLILLFQVQAFQLRCQLTIVHLHLLKLRRNLAIVGLHLLKHPFLIANYFLKLSLLFSKFPEEVKKMIHSFIALT